MNLRRSMGAALLCWTTTTNVHAEQDEAPAGEASGEVESQTDKTTPPPQDESRLDAKRSSARQLATEASIEYRSGEYQDAYDKFNRAFRLVGVPALGVWSARSLRQLNRFVEASERYRDVLKKGAKEDAPQSHRDSLRDARTELDELLPRIPNLVIEIKDADVQDVVVTMDGKEVDRALLGVKQRVDPGIRKVVAQRGSETVTREISLTERETRTLVLPLDPNYVKPIAKKPPKPQSAPAQATSDAGLSTIEVTGIVGMATGGAIFAAGLATTFVALDQQKNLKDDCGPQGCAPPFHSDVDNFNTMKFLSTGALIGGAVIGAAGAALYFGSQTTKEKPKVGLFFRSNSLGVTGNF